MATKTKIAHFPTKINRPLRIATYGDSTASCGLTATSVNNSVTPLGSSNHLGGGDSKAMSIVAHTPSIFIANGGVSGNTTSLMLARGAVALSSTRKAVSDICALKPDVDRKSVV